MKSFLAVLVVTLALPAGALARPVVNSPGHPSESGVRTAQAVSALGTDLTAPDQQPSTTLENAPVVSSPGSFDWGSAGIGAGIVLVIVMLGVTLVMHRRRGASLAA